MKTSALKNAQGEKSDGKPLSDKELAGIKHRYKTRIKIPKAKPRPALLLCPTGLVGSGKTTVVKAISSRLGLVRITTDDIRKLLNDGGFSFTRTHEIAHQLLEEYARKGYSLTLDADCIGPAKEHEIKNFVRRFKLRLVRINIKAPERFIVERLQQARYPGGGIFKDAEERIANYYRRKPLHDRYISRMKFDFVFDSSKPDLPTRIAACIKKLKQGLPV